MTGFEYTAAVGMLYEGQNHHALTCIGDIRRRYDGRRRNPFDETECGRYYARALASWGAVLAWTRFHYSAVTDTLSLAPRAGTWFWSNGSAWGLCRQERTAAGFDVCIEVLFGALRLKVLRLPGCGEQCLPAARHLRPGKSLKIAVARRRRASKRESESAVSGLRDLPRPTPRPDSSGIIPPGYA